jgi:hypothetical protein
VVHRARSAAAIDHGDDMVAAMQTFLAGGR